MSLVAIYDTPQRRILLTADWAPGSPRDQSMIVHELVHHAQALLGRRHDCPQAREEEEAYRLQKEWLQGSGGDLKSEFGIDGLTLLVLTTCGF